MLLTRLSFKMTENAVELAMEFDYYTSTQMSDCLPLRKPKSAVGKRSVNFSSEIDVAMGAENDLSFSMEFPWIFSSQSGKMLRFPC